MEVFVKWKQFSSTVTVNNVEFSKRIWLLNISTVCVQLCVTVVYVQIVCPLKNSPNIAIHSQRTSTLQKSWMGQIVIIVCSMWRSSVCGLVHMKTSKWYHCLVVFSLQALQSKKRPDKQLLWPCVTCDCSCMCGDGSSKLISALLLLSAIALFSLPSFLYGTNGEEESNSWQTVSIVWTMWPHASMC